MMTTSSPAQILMPYLPLEIEELILNFLPELEDDGSHSVSKTCSLVCKAFLLPICRKHIFGSIVLNDYFNNVSSPTTCAFTRLLRESPEIADYIRNLNYNILIADFTSQSESRSIQESLKRISRLESLTVRQDCWSKIDWNNPIRPALLQLLHSPTLTHFTVDINRFVLSDLIPCVNLKYLRIGYSLTELSIQLDEFVATTGSPGVIMLCTARRPDGRPIIDFESLSKIKVDLERHNGSKASQELFGRCPVLTKAHISCM